MSLQTNYIDWNDSMSDLKNSINEIASLYSNFDSEMYNKIGSIKIPYGVKKEFHPQIIKAFKLICGSFSLLKQAWSRESLFISDIVWNVEKKHWVFTGSHLIGSIVNGNGNSTIKSRSDYISEARQNKLLGLQMLDGIYNKL